MFSGQTVTFIPCVSKGDEGKKIVLISYDLSRNGVQLSRRQSNAVIHTKLKEA
jgi:hypothetical protein